VLGETAETTSAADNEATAVASEAVTSIEGGSNQDGTTAGSVHCRIGGSICPHRGDFYLLRSPSISDDSGAQPTYAETLSL